MTERSNSTPPLTAAADRAPRLGTVIRFQPNAYLDGVHSLADSGFRVASSSEFRDAIAVPNDFGGADVQYFERFGIAIVRQDAERVRAFLAKHGDAVVQSARAERRYRALVGTQSRAERPSGPRRIERAYVEGYRDAVVEFADQLLGNTSATPDMVRHVASDESALTWGLQAVKADLSRRTGCGIRVAVLDTGFDETHPDFRGRAVVKKLFASNSSDSDLNGHGTHCVGTACGPRSPVGAPGYGIAYETEIFAGKVVGEDGNASDRSVIAGITWALDQRCHIISMSLALDLLLGDMPDEDFERIGQGCLNAGTLIIAAAGNASARPTRIAPVASPANASTIMAVGAIDARGDICAFSSGGLNANQAVDIAAPGADVLSAAPGGGHRRMDGTSMATPHVAGVAALIAESNASFRGAALWARVLQLAKAVELPARDVGKGIAQALTG
jgi:subtilisin family serine protease